MSTVAAPPAVVWNPWLRAAASLAIVWHLVGVMVAPLSVPPQFAGGDSVLGGRLKTVYQPYITALYLNHAYKFFAPNPGDSHLLRYDLYFADGTKRVQRDEQLFPDRFRHWPRLLYHRYFMLTESLNDFAPPWVWDARPAGNDVPRTPGVAAIQSPRSEIGEAVPPRSESLPAAEAVPPADAGPPFVKTYFRAIAEHLARRSGAVRVDLYYRKHLLPSIENFREVGRRLDSPDSYRERLVLSYRAEPSP